MPIVRTAAALMTVSLASMVPAVAGPGGGVAVAGDPVPQLGGVITATGDYGDAGSKACQHAALCAFSLNPVPSGKVLTVTEVSCSLQVSGSGTIYYLALVGSSLPTYLKPVFLTTYAGVKRYASNDPALTIFKAGQLPSIVIETTATESTVAGNCTIGGEIH